MYLHAWRHREALGLDERERYMCKIEMQGHAYSVAVGLLACGFALLGPAWVPIAGFTFFLLPIGHTVLGVRAGRAFRRRFPESA